MEAIPMGETVAELEKESEQFANKEVPDVGKFEDHKTHIQGHLATRGEVLAQFGLPADAPFEQVQAMVEQVQANAPDSGIEEVLIIIKLIDDHIEHHQLKMEENPNGERLKYPDGWRVMKFYNDILLEDAPNPPGIDEIPLVPFYAYKDKTIYGFGEVKNIHNPQTTLNEVDHKEYKGLKRTANPGWIADKEAEVINEEFHDQSEESISHSLPQTEQR
jgi:hypothetical protein